MQLRIRYMQIPRVSFELISVFFIPGGSLKDSLKTKFCMVSISKGRLGGFWAIFFDSFERS